MKHKTNHARMYSPGRPFHDHHWIARDKTASSTRHGIAPQQRLLCVDDEIEGTRMRGQILEEEGYSVVLYHSPLAALRCDLSMFSLAILDFEMPELNGRELLLRMRALGARFPIVLLTGSVDSLSSENRVLFARCIDKGAPIRCLLDTITEFIGKDQIPDFGSERTDHQDLLRSDRRPLGVSPLSEEDTRHG
jgi:CheY-like chemotaxis protein